MSERALSSGYNCPILDLSRFPPQNAHEDDTCVSELGDTAVECSAFSTFWPYVETPFMIVSSEADPVVHFCADNPALGENTPGSFAREWREGMVELTQQVAAKNKGKMTIFQNR